jgi:hypothetical protein
MPKQRLRITVPRPEATINLGNPDPGARFGWEGISLKSGRHMFVGIEDDVVFQADGSTLFQTDEKWFQYATEMTHATEERLHLTSGEAMILFAGGGQGMHAEDEYVEEDENTFGENTKSPITNTFNKIDLMKQVQTQAAHVRKFLGGSADTGDLGTGFLKKSVDLEVKLGHQVAPPTEYDIEQRWVTPKPPGATNFIVAAGMAITKAVNKAAGIEPEHDMMARFNPYSGPLGVADFMLDAVRKIRIILGTDNALVKVGKELADASKASWKMRDQATALANDWTGHDYGELVGRAMSDKFNEPDGGEPAGDGELREGADDWKGDYKKIDNAMKGWDSSVRAAFEPIDRAFATLSAGVETAARLGRAAKAAARLFTGDYEEPGPLAILAKSGISLGTEDRIYGTASKGFYFVADGGEGELGSDPVPSVLKALDKLDEILNRKKERPKPVSLGFRVRSDSDVDMKAAYFVSLSAVGDPGKDDNASLARIQSAGWTEITALKGVAVGPRELDAAMEMFGDKIHIGVRESDKPGIMVKDHVYTRPDLPPPTAGWPGPRPDPTHAWERDASGKHTQVTTSQIVVSADKKVQLEVGEYLVEVSEDGVRIGHRREIAPAEEKPPKRAQIAIDDDRPWLTLKDDKLLLSAKVLGLSGETVNLSSLDAMGKPGRINISSGCNIDHLPKGEINISSNEIKLEGGTISLKAPFDCDVKVNGKTIKLG